MSDIDDLKGIITILFRQLHQTMVRLDALEEVLRDRDLVTQYELDQMAPVAEADWQERINLEIREQLDADHAERLRNILEKYEGTKQ